MSILIKGMNIPKDCSECMNIMLWNVFECNVSDVEEGQRLSSCPLVDVPTPHGRLIDKDELEVDTEWSDYYDGYQSYSAMQIKYAPTIIESEENIDEKNDFK